MAAAAIRIDQPTHGSIPIGVVGRTRDDIERNEPVTLRNGDNSGVESWRWALLSKPPSSTAALSNPTSALVTFTPDLVGTYRVRLTVNGGLTGEVDTRLVIVRDADGLRIPAFDEGLEGNYLIDGSPNEQGWWPDFAAYLAHVRAEASALGDDLTDLVADVDTLADDLTALEVRLTTAEADLVNHEGRIAALETSVEDLDSAVVYDLDFTALATAALADGPVSIGGLSWTAANLATRTTLASITNGQGLRMTHTNGVSSTIAGGDTAPRISIALSSIIPNYSPRRRYFVFVAYSWAVTPDAAGERFSVGVLGGNTSPWPSSGIRFAGATAHYNSSAGAVVHEGERSNTITNGQAPGAAVLGFSLQRTDGMTIWQAGSMPSASLANITPVIDALGVQASNAGTYDIFHFAAGRLTLALGATGTAGIHSVTVTGLRIIRG
jgi:hypothetical protein